MEKSIVLELQQLATDGNNNITDLLRKTLVVASKLKLTELRTWVHCELNGYNGNPLPAYRKVGATIHVQNPVRGLLPITIENETIAAELTFVAFDNPIAELEDFVTNRKMGGEDAILCSFHSKTEFELIDLPLNSGA